MTECTARMRRMIFTYQSYRMALHCTRAEYSGLLDYLHHRGVALWWTSAPFPLLHSVEVCLRCPSIPFYLSDPIKRSFSSPPISFALWKTLQSSLGWISWIISTSEGREEKRRQRREWREGRGGEYWYPLEYSTHLPNMPHRILSRLKNQYVRMHVHIDLPTTLKLRREELRDEHSTAWCNTALHSHGLPAI